MNTNPQNIQNEYTTLQHKMLLKINRPAPITSTMEEFMQSEEFLILENCMFNSERIHKLETNKFDLENEESVAHASKFLGNLEALATVVQLNYSDRSYRRDFSQTYKLLYAKESISYITEIIDAAQEAYPCLFVNGEKYVFSTDVLDAGHRLIHFFEELKSKVYTI